MSRLKSDRREFLKKLGLSAALATSATAVGRAVLASEKFAVSHTHNTSVMNLTVPKMGTVRFGFIGLGRRGGSMLRQFLDVEGMHVAALCDTRSGSLERSYSDVFERTSHKPVKYTGSDDAWRDLVARDDIDAVYISTPWRLHAPMAIAAMEAGKHAFVEVPAALTVDECWQLVEASEKYQVNCMMLENVCYGREEMMVLNMVRAGIFGELLHGEAAYIHELRGQMEDIEEGTGSWRTGWHAKRNGNLYPTHGLGPIAQYMDINRGDRFDYLVSMSTKAAGRRLYAERELSDDNPHNTLNFINGDMNSSLIRTVNGKTILLQHDTTTPRPYSRHNLIQGTNGVFVGFPNRIALEDNPLQPDVKNGFHHWDENMAKWSEAYDHPVWKKLISLGKVSQDIGDAHANLDFVMLWRIIYCLRNGLPLDQNVYDAAAWSVPNILSMQSVESRGKPVDFPDFTRGVWQNTGPLEVVL